MGTHLKHVINYDSPPTMETYAHRTGRTGRRGRSGQALTLLNPSNGADRALALRLVPLICQTRSNGSIDLTGSRVAGSVESVESEPQVAVVDQNLLNFVATFCGSTGTITTTSASVNSRGSKAARAGAEIVTGPGSGEMPELWSSGGGGGREELRSKLVAFYEHYNPDKVCQTEGLVEKYYGKVTDEDLFAMLRQKYGATNGPMEQSMQRTAMREEEEDEDDGGGEPPALALISRGMPRGSISRHRNPLAVSGKPNRGSDEFAAF